MGTARDFILSPRRRMLVQSGRERPLIPRYFDDYAFGARAQPRTCTPHAASAMTAAASTPVAIRP
jgi:hypothetical protein